MSGTSIDLGGPWRFQPDMGSEGVHRGWFRPEHDTRRWRDVKLPASFEMCMPALEDYEGEGWFRREVTIPAEWKGRRIALRFLGVNYHASVWINGQHVGDHHDGFLPFEFAVQDVLRCGQENTIVVRADNLRREGEVPGMQRGWRTFGGILREVELVATDLLRLDHVSIVAEPTAGGGRIAVRAEVRNDRPGNASVVISASIQQSSFRSAIQMCPKGESTQLAVNGNVDGVKPWSPDRPNLHDVRIELHADGQVVDERTLRIGFRRVEARDCRLFLNGQPIWLTGFNRHEDSPRTNACPDPEMVRQDLLDMKAAGASFVRLAHYPHHPGTLDLCDELGLLAMGEIPLYWWDGVAEGEERCAAKLAAAQRQLTAMIRRDINHPSLIFWSVSNETHEQRPEVVQGNNALLQLARSLDSTRLITHASNHWRDGQAAGDEYEADEMFQATQSAKVGHRARQFDFDDVICVNAYPSLNTRGYGNQLDYDYAESTRYWREHLARLHEKYPDKPILVSEFGSVSLEGVFVSDFGEDAQAQIIAHELAGMDAPYVCGAVVWCWADHPRQHSGFCRYLRTSPYGVVTRERRKLQAYWVCQKLFREKQARKAAFPDGNPRNHTASEGGVTVALAECAKAESPA